MRSLYVKIALLVAIAYLLSFAVVFTTRSWVEDPAPRRPDLRERYLGTGLRYAASELDRAGPEAWSEPLEKMRGSFSMPLAIIDAAALPPQEHEHDEPRDDTSTTSSASTSLLRGAPHNETIYVPLQSGRYYLAAGPIVRPPHKDNRALIPVYISVSLSVLSALLIATPITRRLRKLLDATRAISQGDLDVRVTDRSSDIVGELALSFNAMAERLRQLFCQRDQLLQAVSHELSTPLSRLRFLVAALEGQSEPAVREKRLQAIEEELVELDHISAELTSWVDADGRKPTSERLAIAPVLRSMLARDEAASSRAIRIELDVPDDELTLTADERQLRRAIENIFRNAVRHARTKVVLRAALEHGGVGVRVEVSDDGPGIPEAERKRVFEPFARLDASRSRTEGGLGLGLAITKRIVEGHGGKVWIETAPTAGAKVVTIWPT
jgi:two-component system sensor histidine kinase RstB